MILIDSNIPMYLVGSIHRHKAEAKLLLEHCIAAGDRLVTDAEVLQEILHRYTAINRLEALEPAFRALLGIVDTVFPVEEIDVVRAKEILLGNRALSARDALHVAIMERRGVRRILSFDRGFDGVGGIKRLHAGGD